MPEPAKTKTRKPRVAVVPEPTADPATGTADATDEVAGATNDVAAAVAEAAEQVADTAATGAEHAPGTCPVAWCPICLAVTAVQPLNPQVVEHLLKAGTELLLAFRGVLDARGDDLSGADAARDGATRLEKIDLG
jgi:hypothetical protein